MEKRTCKPSLAIAAALLVVSTAVCAANDQSTAVYKADLKPLNANVTGLETQGDAELVVEGNMLEIQIEVKDAPPGITHWQHFHGFIDGSEASCPDGSADANGDKIVDLIETHPYTGKTLVPFDAKPAAMDIAHGDYPEANADGTYAYSATVPLDKLQNAFAKAYDGNELELESRAIYIHGAPLDIALPDSVASLGPIPAHTTLPIACGELRRAEQ